MTHRARGGGRITGLREEQLRAELETRRGWLIGGTLTPRGDERLPFLDLTRTAYTKDAKGTIRRLTPKARGKAARADDKRLRRAGIRFDPTALERRVA
jgi:hypothetical protein